MGILAGNKPVNAIKGIASDYMNSYTDIASNIAYSAVREFGSKKSAKSVANAMRNNPLNTTVGSIAAGSALTGSIGYGLYSATHN